jgi:hypothetical protein
VRSRFFRRVLPWLALGFIIGAGIGLLLGWVAWPLEISDADPAAMDEIFQVDYTLMIASAYSEDDDLTGARIRLGHLAKDDAPLWVLGVTVDQILDGAPEADILMLVNLANDLGQTSPAMEPYLQLLYTEQES